MAPAISGAQLQNFVENPGVSKSTIVPGYVFVAVVVLIGGSIHFRKYGEP